MKMKGIGTFEQNADKIVLGVVALVGVGALTLQLLAGGSTIKVGTQEVPPGSAFQPIAEEAQRLLTRVQSDSPTYPEAPKFSLAGKLALGKDLVRTPAPKVAFGPAPKIGKGDTGAVIAAAEYAQVEVPAPSTPDAVAYSATISPFERIRYPELAALLPEKQPFDKAAVSIQFTFSGADLKAALSRDPDDQGPIEPIPLSWWQGELGADLVTLLGVEVERELVSGPEGVTPSGETTAILPTLPGRFDSMKVWSDNVKSIGDVPVTVDALRGAFDQIARPAFYSTIAGPKWEEPSKVAARGDDTDKVTLVRNWRRRFGEADRKVADLTDLLARTPKPDATRREPTRDPQPPSRTGGGGKGGPGPSATPTTRPAESVPRTGDYRAIERSLKRAQQEKDAIAQKLIALGETVEGYDQPAASGGEADAGNDSLPFLESPSVKMWAHDLTGLPGATYRYRARAIINNPLFDRNLQEGSQKELGKDSVLRGDWSEWSAPVTVDPAHAFFITSADDRVNEIAPRPHALAKIYQFYYGYYREAEVSLEPGDVVMNDAKLPELRVADMSKLEEMIKKGLPEAAPGGPAMPPPPSGPPPAPRGRTPGVQSPAPQAPAPGGEPSGPSRQTGTEGEKPKIQWPEWLSVELPKSLPLGVDATLLDVSSVPAGDRPKAQAVLRLGNGEIFIKPPDAKNPLLKRLEASAKAGETQGFDLSQPEPERRPLFPGRDRDPTRTPTGKPGGGGGGGG